MSTKTIVISVFTVFLVAFALGRYSVSAPSVKIDKTTEIDENTKTNTDTHKVTTITEDCATGKKVTTITENTNTKSEDKKDTDIKLDKTVTPQKTSTLNVSALAGTGLFSSLNPVYGASITKELIGPITVGGFGLTNGVVGVSIGLNF